MSRAKRAIHRQHRVLWLSLGAATVVIAATGVAIAQLASDGTPSGQFAPSASHSGHGASNPAHGATSPAPSGGSPSVQGQSVVGWDAEGCAREIRTTEAVVAAAHTATEHWREHVQAQTDLQLGKNSEAETKAIWKRTRLAGPADIAALDSALTAQSDSRGGCTNLPAESAASCKARLAALDAAATADRVTAGDWANHLAAMAAHAAGDFGSGHAQELWVAAWSGATMNLNRAVRANDALSKAPACHPV